MQPLHSSLFGLIGTAGLILLASDLAKEKTSRAFKISLFLNIIINLCIFHFIWIGVHNLSGSNLFVSFLAFLFYSIFLNSKVFLFLFLSHFVLKKTEISKTFFFPTLALSLDLFLYQLFPWHFGDLISSDVFSLQIASLTGIYGLSFLSFLYPSVLLSLFGRLYQKKKQIDFPLFKRESLYFPLLLIFTVYLYGFIRVISFPKGTEENLNIALVQTNTAVGTLQAREDEAYAKEALNKVFNYSLKAIFEAGKEGLDLLILPESAVPFFSTEATKDNLEKKAYSSTFQGIILFLSRISSVSILYNEVNFENQSAYNSATLFSRTDKTKEIYHKQILVPFGESLPFSFLEKLFPESSKYKKSQKKIRSLSLKLINHKNLSLNPQDINPDKLGEINRPESIFHSMNIQNYDREIKLLPLLCYEAIFPEFVREAFLEKEKPEIIINQVNDSWFGNLWENHQHNGIAIVRAVETGRYFIRSSLSGVSSVTSPIGNQVISETKINTEDIRIFKIPVRETIKDTPYIIFGNLVNYIILLFFGIILFVSFYNKHLRK